MIEAAFNRLPRLFLSVGV